VRTVVFVVCALLSSSAWACGVEGEVTRSDGSKVDKTATISTSWDSSKAYPKKGWYELDLGSSACGASINIYVDGNNSKRITLPSSGNLRVDYVLK